MKQLEPILDDIEIRVLKLSGHLKHLEREIAILKEEQIMLKNENDALRQQLLQAETRLAASAAGVVLVQQDEAVFSTGDRLNELIREIDKCINLLEV